MVFQTADLIKIVNGMSRVDYQRVSSKGGLSAQLIYIVTHRITANLIKEVFIQVKGCYLSWWGYKFNTRSVSVVKW